MKIGQVAAQAGVSIDTVRFYERRGVLPAPHRTPSGYRIYEASTIERISFARALQRLGFTLDEATDALHSHDTGQATCESELWRMQAVIDRIDTKIAELQATHRDVSETMAACQQGHCRFDSTAPLTPTAQRH
ncbi:MAG: MerR family transcriptional regulator [Propionibacteriaceae bacterium]